MNIDEIKEVINTIKGHIIINEKVENQILDIIKMDVYAARFMLSSWILGIRFWPKR